MRLQRLYGSVGGLGGQGDVQELLLVSDVGEGVAHAALEVVPGDVVLFCGSHDGGGDDAPEAIGVDFAVCLYVIEETEICHSL